MMNYVCLIIGYLCGSFLTAEIVAKANGKDVRKIDPTTATKGNPGTTNVMLNIGFKQGLIVLAGDLLKVVIACTIAYLIYHNPIVFLYTGYGCVLGHDFSFLYKFNGGKGVVVTIAWLIFLMPKYCWFIFIALGILACVSGYLNLVGVMLPIVATPILWFYLYPTAGILMFIVALISLMRNKLDLQKTFSGQYKRTFPLQRLFGKKN